MIRRLAHRAAGVIAGLLVVQFIVCWEPAPLAEQKQSPVSALSVVTGTTEVRANDQEACPCHHQLLCCWEALREWWFEHGHWPGVDDEGGDADEVLIRTNPSEPPNGEPTEIDR